MARVKGALATRKRRKKVLKLAKGYWGSKSRHFKICLLYTSNFNVCGIQGIGFLHE